MRNIFGMEMEDLWSVNGKLTFKVIQVLKHDVGYPVNIIEKLFQIVKTCNCWKCSLLYWYGEELFKRTSKCNHSE